jgi:hypothetical protein
MAVTFLNRGFFQRIFGLPATPKPIDPQCWNFGDGKLLSVGKSTYTYDGKKVYGLRSGIFTITMPLCLACSLA